MACRLSPIEAVTQIRPFRIAGDDHPRPGIAVFHWMFSDSLHVSANDFAAEWPSMLRAEKKKFAAQQRQLQKIKTQLFPNNNLQERTDNLMPYYAKWGKDFIKMIYENSKGLEQEFGILEEI